MIDEKRITEAMNTYIGYAKEGIETSMRRDAFRAGVEWFKNTLWHDAKDVPEIHKGILVQWKYKGRICYETNLTEREYDWQYTVIAYNIIKWCYLADLFPKGGDK